MSDVLEPSDDDQPETDEDVDPNNVLNEAIDRVESAIEGLLSILGETTDSILTDWAVVAVSQGMNEEGYPTCSDAIVLPKRYIPGYRLKGLLYDALDQLRADEAHVIVVPGGHMGDEDE